VNKYKHIVMPEQRRHLANKCEDIVNLHGAEAYCVSTRTACIKTGWVIGNCVIKSTGLPTWQSKYSPYIRHCLFLATV